MTNHVHTTAQLGQPHNSPGALPEFSLQDRYAQKSGWVLLSGIQALVRSLQTRAELDKAAGLNTAGFVSGYRGSPLGGLDKELWAQQALLDEYGIRFQPGVNEDLAATAVWGSQQVGLHPGATKEGVFGLWYGKAPGLDRSCDAIRHANAWGTQANGGVVLVVGDDPGAKSSSLASQSEFTLQDLMVPILAPASVQDVLEFTVLGWQMSRYCGLWVGLKALADHMDSAALVHLDPARYRFELPQPASADLCIRQQDTPWAQEQRLVDGKIPAALTFAQAAQLNQWVTRDMAARAAPDRRENDSRLGIIAAGKAYADLREALACLDLHTEADISSAGIEILKLGMTWPLETELVRRFATTVDHVLVLEEKRAFVEVQVKEALFDERVQVAGKRSLGLPEHGILLVHDIIRLLCQQRGWQPPHRLTQGLAGVNRAANAQAPAREERTPLFCAGCPHNTSTRVPDDSRATAGIGCHYMVQWMDRDTDGCTHMGGEGVNWVGEAPFTTERHVFANLGDGTYFHSGLLAIRQALAAGVNITYKILFNDAVAMTGGQPTDGDLEVTDIVRQVAAEGVQKIVIVSDEPAAMRQSLRAQNLRTSVVHRRDLDRVQQELRDVPGVSVLIYQQTCATELRRRRKRGLLEDDKPRIVINEALCDGCGDCTVQSSCVAVEPVPGAAAVGDEQASRRRINQTLCNKDLSCAEGYCPAMVEVRGALAPPPVTAPSVAALRDAAPAPAALVASANVLVAGVGGTGIVTLSSLLAVAAKLDGKFVQTLDMTGLAQKGGAVFGHIRIADQLPHVARIPHGGADIVVGCDLVAAASSESLALLAPRTEVVLNSHVTPTAEFVLQQNTDTQARRRLQRLKAAGAQTTTYDAVGYCEALLGGSQQANIFMLGCAYQNGRIPLTLASIERAINLNGVAVQDNLRAFHMGRLAVADAAQLQTLRFASEQVPGSALTDVPNAPLPLDKLLETQAEFLLEYADAALAGRYQKMVAKVAAVEQQLQAGSAQLTRVVANNYVRVLAAKDEFEVARLYQDEAFAATLERLFQPGARLTYLMAPPLLGERKRRFGRWMRPVLGLLARCKGLRDTWLDPFRFTRERRRHAEVVSHFEALIAQVLPELTLQNRPTAMALLSFPQHVRGFGHVKQQQWEAALAREEVLLRQFYTPAQPVKVFDPKELAA